MFEFSRKWKIWSKLKDAGDNFQVTKRSSQAIFLDFRTPHLVEMCFILDLPLPIYSATFLQMQIVAEVQESERDIGWVFFLRVGDR